MKLGRLILLLFNVLFATISCVLISRLWHSKKQEAYMLSRIDELTSQQNRLCEEFELKQDYMRKMISDGEFVEQIIREKTGLSKQNEIIFKFGD
ncbi:MAG: septum formation initiator family protein [Puniceicoccales bacterium]|jgi:cell division protein FtsB|nr:septum formation initiator family protein [Puniceicoccales bacterium]